MLFQILCHMTFVFRNVAGTETAVKFYSTVTVKLASASWLDLWDLFVSTIAEPKRKITTRLVTVAKQCNGQVCVNKWLHFTVVCFIYFFHN